MKQLLKSAKKLGLLVLMIVLVQTSYSQNPIDAGDNQSVCGDTYMLNASLPDGCVGMWSLLGGSATIVDATNPQTKVTSLGVGYNTFKWTVSGKAMGEDYVVITNVKVPVSAGIDKVVCEDNALLNAGQFAGTWTIMSGTATIVSPSAAITVVKNLSAGDNVFRWTVNIQGCISTDELVVRFQKPVVSAGVSQTICSSETQLSASLPTNANGQWRISAGGGTLVNINNPSTKVTGLLQGTNEFVWTVSDGVCTASDKVTIVNTTLEAFAGIDFAVCTNATQLNAKTQTDSTNAYWSVVAGNGTFANAKMYNTIVTDLKSGTNIFRWTVASNNCSASDDVMVIYNKAEANAGAYQYVCASNAILQAAVPTAGSGYWTVTAGTGIIVNATLANSAVTNLALGVNKFNWIVTNGACKAESMVAIFNNKVEALVTDDFQVCGQDAMLVAKTPTLGKGFWTNLGTSAVIADVNAISTKVTQLASGANVFRWTVTNANCISSKELTVTSITGTSLLANAGTDQSVCGVTATLAANDPSLISATGVWTAVGTTTATFVNASLYNTQVSNLQVGANAFRWNVSKGNCNSSDEVIITNNKPLAIATASSETCSMDGVLNATLTPNARGLWTSSNSAVKIEFPEQAITKVHGLVAGNNTFTWTIYNPACPTATTSTNVTIVSTQVAVSAGKDQNTCVSSATLAADIPSSNYRGTWQIVEGSGTFSNVNAYNSVVKDLRQGINRFQWLLTNGVCQSTSIVTINYSGLTFQMPASMSVCDSVAYITAPLPASTSGVWTCSNSKVSIEKPNAAYTKVSGLQSGENLFTWTVSNSVCSKSGVLNVIKNTTLSGVSAGSDQTVCILETNLAATTPPAGATGQWVVVYGNGTFANATLNSTNVINLAQGENRFAWIVRNGDCKAYDEVIITRNAASVANAGNAQTICSTSAVLAANTPSYGKGKWIRPTTNITIADSLSAVTQVSNLPAGSSTFRWLITNGTCTSYSDVIITNNTFSVDAGADQTTCGGYVQMNGKTSATNMNWQVIYGYAYIQTPTSLTTFIGNMVGNNIVLRLTGELNGCKAYDDMVIYNNQVIAVAGESTTICGSDMQLAANSPTKGIGVWSIVSGNGTFVNNSIYNTTVSALGNGANTLRWTITYNGCTSYSDMIITTKPSFSIPDFSAGTASQTACGDVVLGAALPTGSMTGRWKFVSGEGTFDNASLGTTTVRNLRLGYNTLRWEVTGTLLGCTRSKDITINYIGTSSKVIVPTITVCEPKAQLMAYTPSIGTGIWTSSGTTATIDANTRFNAVVSNLKTGENKFIWTVSFATCSSQSTITVNYQPVQLNAIADQETCSNTALISNTNTQAGTWQILSGTATIVNSTAVNATLTNLAQGVTMLRFTAQSGNCRGYSDVKITNRQPVDVSVEPDKTVCEPNILLTANRLSSGLGEWASKGTAVVVDKTNFATQITGLVNGVNTFTWTVSIAGISNCYVQKTVNVTRNVVTANAGSNQNVCTTNATLNATGSGYWTIIGGSGIIVNATLNNSAVTNLSNGTNTFMWNTYQGVCKATAMVNIYNSSIKADGGYDVQTCDNMVKLVARVPENLTQGYWTVSTGTGIIENPTMAQTVVKKLSTGLSTVTWTAINGNCIDRNTINITVYAPSTAVAGDDQTINATSTTLIAASPLIGTGYWQKVTGTGIIANPSIFNTSVTGLSTGLNIFRWIVANGTCTSADEVVILKTDATINAGVNQTVCANKAKMNAMIPAGAKGTWKLISGRATIVNTTSATTEVNNLGRGVNTFAFIVDISGVVSSSYVNIESRDIKAFAGANQVICQDNVVLKANTLKDVMQGTWSLMEGNGTIENATAFESKVSNLARGRNVFRWTMQNNQCADYAEVIIYNQTIDVPTNGYTMDGNTFKYVGTIDSKIDSWYWDFNDGTYSTAINPNHTYQKDGYYQICLTLANKTSGCISKDCGTIAIGTTQAVMNDKLNFDYELVTMGDYTKLILTNSATGFDNFAWDFGDGKFESFKQGTHIYTQSGFFKVCLRAKANGVLFTQCKDITIENKKLDALKADFDFFINPTSPSNSIAFRNSASENVRRFQWDFGDGRMDSLANPIHVFTKAGYYNVCLKVYNDSLKAVAQKCAEVQVLASATNYCQAKFEYQIDPANQQVTLLNKSLGTITDYQWDLGDGKPMTIKDPAAFSFTKAGAYKIILKVKNATTQCYSEYSATIAIGTVNQSVTKLDFASYVNRDNDTVYFKDASMGAIQRMIWDFGDGQQLEGFAPQHKYTKAGTYKVCISAMDSTQHYYQLCKDVTVYDKNNVGVETKAAYAYFIDSDNQTVRFVDKSVGNVSKWTWDFGNRNYSMIQNPVYSFSTGNYQVCLNIFDAVTTQVSRYCENILIKGANFATKVVDARFATFVDASSKQLIVKDESVGEASKWYWTFGDGEYASTQSSGTLAHIYKGAGTYEVCLIAFDKVSAAQSKLCKQIVIDDPCKIHADFTYFVDNQTNTLVLKDASTGMMSSYYYWNFGDNKTSTETNVKHVYSKPAIYNVTFAVISASNKTCVDKISKVIAVGQLSVSADFDYIVDETTNSIQFINKSVGSTFYWKFDDGGSSTEKAPTYAFKEAGIHVVTLVVSDASGQLMSRKEVKIQVGKVNCSANFTMFVDSLTNTVQFKNTVLGTTTKLYWEFGDGGTSTESNPIYRYQTSGYRKVTLTTSAANCMDKHTEVLVISNEGKGCYSDFEYQVDGAKLKLFDKSGGDIMYYVWNFGDQSANVVNTQNPEHTFVKAGFYNVCLNVVNKKGISNLKCKSVKIIPAGSTDNLLKADFVYTVDSLSKTINTYDKSKGEPNKWTWIYPNKTDLVQNSTYTAQDTGYVLVKFYVENTTLSSKDYISQLIKVGTKFSGIKAAFTLQSNPTTLKAGGYPVDLTGAAFGDPAKMVWDFGDGTIDSTSTSPNHVYLKAGTYTICLTATDPETSTISKTCEEYVVTGISEELSSEVGSLSTYPNPFSTETNISYNLIQNSTLELAIYNLLGEKLLVLKSGYADKGSYNFKWNSGAVKAGLYLLKLRTANGELTNKLIINK